MRNKPAVFSHSLIPKNMLFIKFFSRVWLRIMLVQYPFTMHDTKLQSAGAHGEEGGYIDCPKKT